MHHEWYRDSVQDLLDRLVEAGPAKACTQDRVPVADPLPGLFEQGGIDRLGQVTHHLLDVDADVAALEVMEQHPLLQGRERVGVDHRRTRHEEPRIPLGVREYAGCKG